MLNRRNLEVFVYRSMPLAAVHLPGHKKHNQPLLRRPQHSLVTQLKTLFKLYRFNALLPNARSRAARANLPVQLDVL